MKQFNPDRLRQNLNTVVDDVEQILHSMSEATGDQIDDLKSSAGNHLHNARYRLGAIERQTAAQLRHASRQARGYAREHPWQVVGGLTAIAVALAVMARKRH